jgi:hypothetical protein
MTMSLGSLEQIVSWLVKSLWPLLKQYTIPITSFWVAVAAIYIIFKIKKLFRSNAEPDITYAQIKIEPFDLPSFRYIQGCFIAVNSGHQPCKITRVQVLHENLNFEITDISDEVRDQINPREKGKIGIQLPLQIKDNKTSQIFFLGTHKIETFEELPETLSLEVTFDCRKEPLMQSMKRESGKKTYVS